MQHDQRLYTVDNLRSVWRLRRLPLRGLRLRPGPLLLLHELGLNLRQALRLQLRLPLPLRGISPRETVGEGLRALPPISPACIPAW